MKRKLLSLLPVAAVLLTASCTDNQYDLSNINTESRFTAKGLVIPLNMDPIELDAIIDIDTISSDIKKDKEDGSYFFQKEGSFQSENVNVEKITIAKPADIHEKVTVTIPSPDIIDKISDMTIGDILNDHTLSTMTGINANTEIYKVEINDTKDINLKASNIDSRITKLEKLGIDPITISVDVTLDGLIQNISIEELTIGLPCGLTITNISNNGKYNTTNGELSYKELNIENGKVNIQGTVTELTYAPMEAKGAKFDANNHTFNYVAPCNIKGKAVIKASQLNPDAKLNDIKNVTTFTSNCNVTFSNALVVNSFSGGVKIKNIDVDPVNINNLPEFLQQSGTNLQLSNPQLYLGIDGLNNYLKDSQKDKVEANLCITRIVDGNRSALDDKTIEFKLAENKKVLSPSNENLKHEGYIPVSFPQLKDLLCAKDDNGSKVPNALEIQIKEPTLDVTDFSLGNNYAGVTGNWQFYTKLSLTENANIKYIKEWNDWQSKDLDNLTVEKAIVNCTIKKKIAMDAGDFEFTLLGKDDKGRICELNSKEKIALQGEEEQPITIELTGKPLKNIYGGKVTVNLKGKGKDLNKDQTIEISNLHVIVDGYYDTDF